MEEMPAGETMQWRLTHVCICWLLCSAILVCTIDCSAAFAASVQNPSEVLRVPELEAGFRLLYELKLEQAYVQFRAWQKSHPQDPLGSAAEAAAFLFEESYRQGVNTGIGMRPDLSRTLE
jgi:hypothetical protein